jgi:hypothetical protein
MEKRAKISDGKDGPDFSHILDLAWNCGNHLFDASILDIQDPRSYSALLGFRFSFSSSKSTRAIGGLDSYP